MACVLWPPTSCPVHFWELPHAHTGPAGHEMLCPACVGAIMHTHAICICLWVGFLALSRVCTAGRVGKGLHLSEPVAASAAWASQGRLRVSDFQDKKWTTRWDKAEWFWTGGSNAAPWTSTLAQDEHLRHWKMVGWIRGYPHGASVSEWSSEIKKTKLNTRIHFL